MPNLSTVTDMSSMFNGANKFNGVVSNWDVSNVTNMSRMFSNASSFNGNVSNWNVSNVTNMSGMFNEASIFNQDLSSWASKVSNVTDMSSMFLRALKFNGSLANWDVSKVTNMSLMFFNTTAFNQDLSSWGTKTASVTNMSNMFSKASIFNGALSNWDVSNVLNMSKMFSYATAFNQDLSSWGTTTSNVTNMNAVFYEATSFNQDLSSWDVSNVEDMSFMFYGASAFNNSLANWNMSNVTNISLMFYGAIAFNQELSSWGSNMGNVTNMRSVFSKASIFNKNLSSWDVSNVTDMSSMFSDAIAFNQDLSSWKVSNVEDMSEMFYKASSFNGSLSNWDVTNVTNMESMFLNAIVFNQELASWGKTTGNVTNMFSMFAFKEKRHKSQKVAVQSSNMAFNQDISSWVVTSVGDMSSILDNTAMSINNYNKLLNAWSKQEVQSGVAFGASGLSYCDGLAGRNILEGKGWVITGDKKDCAPSLISSSPANDATNIALDANLTFTFNRDIALGQVAILLTKEKPSVFKSSAKSVGVVNSLPFEATISGKVLTINPTNNFEAFTDYRVVIQEGSITDTTGDSYKGTSVTFKTVNKTTPTITFNDFKQTYGDNAVKLEATSSSTGAVNYTIVDEANGASISSDKLTLGNAGTLKVKATIAADANYFEISKEITVTVVKATQMITFGEVTHDSNDKFDLIATATSGLAVTFTSSNTDVATISGKSITVLSAGETTITAFQSGNNNYEEATAVKQILNINVLGIDDNETLLNGISLYPNPSNNFIKIDLSTIEKAKVQVFDLLGKLVLHKKEYVSKQYLDISNLKGGVYLVRVSIGNKQVIKKIIKN